ncbi:DUF58 domain-containing protein [soil metagenome]
MFTAMQLSVRSTIGKWLYRHREIEPGEVFLNQRRVFIVPTSPGFTFGLLLVLLFFGSVNYSLSLGFALTFLLAGCAVIGMHMTFRNLAHLHLSSGRASPVFAGDEARFELFLINRRKHDRFALFVGFIGEGIPDLPQAVDVAADASTSLQLTCATQVRGWLSAPRIILVTRFPLGLFRAWSYWRPDVKALVYPQPEENAPPLPMDGAADRDGQGRGGNDDFAGVRAYQAGDSMRRLAWRQIARVDLEYGGALVSKHFEGGAGSQLCLDFASLPRALDVEQRLSRMTRWVLEAEARGLPYAFRLGEVALDSAIGPAHQAICLRALALYGNDS